MSLTLLDIAIVLACILGLAWVIIRLALTVIPLQIKEARVKNGLAKLRRQLLIGGVSIIVASTAAFVILMFWILGIRSRLLTEFLLLTFVLAFVVIAEYQHTIYHQQYTPEHKELSRQIQKHIDKKGGSK